MNITVKDLKLLNLEWPGWSLDKYSFSGEFDQAARIRMINGGRILLDYLIKYKTNFDSILEIGPFFNPLMDANFIIEGQQVVFWENDPYAFKWLKERYRNNNSLLPMNCDIRNIFSYGFLNNSLPHKYLENFWMQGHCFNAVIASQVLNYIDYKLFLSYLNRFIAPEGLIFINNVVNYGIPEFFSKDRPTSIGETIETIENLGFDIIDSATLPPPKAGEENRFILIGRKK